MKQEQKIAEAKPQRTSYKAWIGWTLLAAFIVGTIAFLMVIDSIYAPGQDDPATLPEAVGK